MANIKISETKSKVEASRLPDVKPNQSLRLESISSWLMIVTVFLSPLLFFPSRFVFQEAIKVPTLSILVIIGFILFLLARLKDGVLVVPKHAIFIASGFLALVYLISSFTSVSFSDSFIGSGSSIGTFAFIFVLCLSFLVSALLFRSQKRFFYLYIALFASFVVLAIFHLLRLSEVFFDFRIFNLTFFQQITSNTVGKWYDLGIFFGFVSVLLIATLQFLKLGRVTKFFIGLSLLIALFFLALINFIFVWWCLGVLSLIILVYTLSFGSGRSGHNDESTSLIKKIPVVPFIILLVALTFILVGGPINTAISKTFNISSLDVRPTINATYLIGKVALKDKPFFGVGPGQFSVAWLQNKPAEVNLSPFWNTDFNFGFGYILTAPITTGLVGALAWLIFIGAFIYLGIQTLGRSISNHFLRYLLVSSFLGALYLLVADIFYTPSSSILFLTFIFIGLFTASASMDGLPIILSKSILDKPRANFVYVSVITVIFVGVAAFGYLYVQKLVATTYFDRGVVAYADGQTDSSENKFIQASALGSSAIYERTLADFYLDRMNRVVSNNSLTADQLREQFSLSLTQAESSALQAVRRNQNDYQSWLTLGRIYETIVPTNIPNSYDNAKTAYTRALELNPHSPLIMALLGRLEITNANDVAAREFLNRALLEKPDYSDAQQLLSSIGSDF